MISKILSDYRKSKKRSVKEFVADQWKDYLYMTDTIDSDDQTKESIVKITLYKVLMQRESIKAIKRGANL